MLPRPSLSCALRAHPSTPAAEIGALQVGADLAPAHVRLHYTLHAPLDRLRIPPASSAPAATDHLWRHTCFEAFVASAAGPAYREFNFSPSGDWAGYAFSGERQRDPAHEPLPAPRIAVQRAADALVLTAELPLAALPPADAAPWRLGLTAVIEAADGRLSYWALAHPRDVPDFHHAGGWTAGLEPSK